MNNEYNKQNNGGQNRQFNNNNENNVKPAPQVETSPCVCEGKQGGLRNIADKTTNAVKSVGNAFKEAPVKTTALAVAATAAIYGTAKAIGYTARQIKAHGFNPKNWDKPQIHLNPFKKKVKEEAPAQEQPQEENK